LKSPSRRWIPVAASVALQLFIGLAYIWSVFQTGVAQSLFGGNNATAGVTYSLALLMMTIGSVAGGRMCSRFSLRGVVITGSILLGGGFLASGLVTSACPWLLWLTYGVIGGLGLGLSYSTTIACAQAWYPDKKGLMTGLVVAGLGVSALIFAPVAERLVEAFGGQGVGELPTLALMGGVILIICVPVACLLRMPEAAEAPARGTTLDVPLGTALRAPLIYVLLAAMFCSNMGGLLLIGFAKPIAEIKNLAAVATMGIMVISVCNTGARLLCGGISDKIGRIPTIMALMVLTGVAAPLITMVEGPGVFALFAAVGFGYGGSIAVFPALVAEIYGPRHLATLYGVVLLGPGSAAIVASVVGGYYRNQVTDEISPMLPAFLLVSACAVVGLVLMSVTVILRKRAKQRASLSVESDQ